MSTKGFWLHIVGADDSVRPVPLSLRRGRRPRRPVSARLLFRSVGADDPVLPVPLSFRASARTGVGIRFPLPPSASEVAARSAGGGNDIARQFLSPNRLPDTPPPGALQRGAAALTGRRTPRAFVPLRSTAGRRPLRAVQRTCPIGRLALRPPFIPASVSSRAAEQSIPPVMQCAHPPFHRQQASSRPLTCHGMVPQASRTALFPDTTKPRDFRRRVLCWRYLSSQAVSSQVLSAEANLTDLSRDGAAGIPNSLFPDTTKPRDFRRGVSCWRYLSSQAVSSQVFSAEVNLTDLSRDGAAGIPNCTFPA